MDNTAQNPLRVTAISYYDGLLKISKPHDPIPKSEHFYFWGDNRIQTSLKLNAKEPAVTRKVDAATYKDEAAISALAGGKKIVLYYVDDWDEANNSISFFAQ